MVKDSMKSDQTHYSAGNFLGPLVFKEEEAPLYRTGWITTVATSAAAVVLALVYRFICAMENRKRDRDGQEAFEHAYEDDLTGKMLISRTFTYVGDIC